MSKNALNSVKVAAPPTNSFDLTHDVKLSCNMGDLIPVLAKKCMPGDRWRIGCENIVRLAPMLAPMMHRVDVRVEYFFVPNRIMWPDWEFWITGNNVGDQPFPSGGPVAYPYFEYGSGGPGMIEYATHPLLDYMGLPDPAQCANEIGTERISVLPFAAYQRIYKDYYRDENLIALTDGNISVSDGDNTGTTALFELRKRAWEADYFTKALPFAQKGEPVSLPIGTFPDVSVFSNDQSFTAPDTQWSVTDGVGPVQMVVPVETADMSPVNSDLFADTSSLTTVTSTTINDWRTAMRLQEWLEKNARGGTRYSELIRAHFNVTPQDSRLQRPEYIVGVKNPIQISEVLNTTGTDDAPQGTMAGHGIGYTKGNYGKYFCSEHGWIIGILSIMPKTAYQQGIPREFFALTDPTEEPWPTFANLGEQPILNKEIMAFQDDSPDPIFGYTPRYMEMKIAQNRVAGDFRGNLDFWHMGRIFDPMVPPVLNGDFVTSDPTLRVFAVTDPEEDHIWAQCLHHIHVVRSLPFYGTPTF